jgi:hypothetical protein
LALTAAAYLDHAIERLLKTKLAVELTQDEERRIFDGASNGILGGANAKLRIA